ncbi:MAG: oxygen-independent coproporphyrinogen III oxidase [Rhodobacteraceae bacterium]|nr:oxygen-independent coproporphyrinogen III oxidase [Paracoccaceae bacterium]
MTHNKQLAALGLFDAKVPRYTSYPTSPQFSTGVQATNFSEWLGAVPAGDSVSLYVHIPFCRRLCWFCACRTQGVRTGDPVQSYLGTLLDEIRMVAAALPGGVRLNRLHWGGGTPTLLNPAQIATLAGTIADGLPFAEGYEFSVEIDPTEVDDGRLDALAAAGMNRASMGVQDFDPDIQKVIGREQSFEITAEVAGKLRARGIHSLNADILYGLPHQDTASITATTEKLLSLGPDRVALYGYAHVPWMAKRQTMIPEQHLPGSENRLGLFETANDLFLASGYNAIGIDHFARPDDGLNRALEEGRLRRNFQGYTDDTCDTLIGLGASAISKFRQGFVQNAAATSAYLARVRDGAFASARGHAFSAEDHLRSRVIEELMCTFRLDLDAVEAELDRVPVDLRSEMARVHQKFAPFTEHSGSIIQILPEGRSLTRMIAREFDAYAMSASGHSLAI